MDIKSGAGKLTWRVEWAARWKIFGVTCEPFGKIMLPVAAPMM